MLADQMGHFTPYDIGTALLGMLAAALLAFIVGLIAKAGSAPSRKEMAATAAVVALGVCFVRASVPLSIALVAVVLLLRGEVRDSDRHALLLRLAAVVIGVGCGSSASIIVLALSVPLGLLLRWASTEKP